MEAQKNLFDNIRPLFANKPLLVVANKTDVWKDNLTPEKQVRNLKNSIPVLKHLNWMFEFGGQNFKLLRFMKAQMCKSRL